jgi:hypothetical protein
MGYRHLLLTFIMFLLIINVVSADSPAPKILLVGDAHFPSDTLNTTIYKFYSDALIANGYSFDSFNVTSRVVMVHICQHYLTMTLLFGLLDKMLVRFFQH